VFYRGTDNDIHELWLSPAGPWRWQTGDLTQSAGAAPATGDPAAYVTPFDDTARAVYGAQTITSTSWRYSRALLGGPAI
jgi:hypothetical protein